MTTYQLSGEGYVIRDGDTKVPITDSPWAPNTNPDFLAYKQWLADGGVPLPADPVVLTPEEIVARIQELEDQYLMPRITRESLIALAEERGAALGLTKAQLAAKNKGYAGLVALEEQIEELRSQLP